MVPYIGPKSKRPAKPSPKDTKTSMNDLANELLFEIMNMLPTQDVLNLRAVCKSILPACNTIVKERCRTLFLHPAPTPMRRALEICAPPYLGKEIEEVVLLGKPSLDEQDNAWPWVFPVGIGGDRESSLMTMNEVHEKGKYSFDNLMDSLKRLKKLRSIAFAEKVSHSLKGASFNQVSEQQINSYAFSRTIAPTRRSRQNAERPLYRSNADVFYDLAASSRFQFRSLRTECELRSPPTLRPVRHLSSLDLTIDTRNFKTRDYCIYSALIEASQSTLQSLRMALPAHTQKKVSFNHRTLHSLLSPHEFPQLRTLKIDALVEEGGKRRDRPQFQMFNMAAFRERLKERMEVVSLRNIFFVHDYTQNPLVQTVATTMEMLKRVAQDPGALQRFEWRLPRFQHHRLCKRMDDEDFVECVKYGCGVYDPFSLVKSTSEDFDKLSVDMSVEYNFAERGWDFGEFVMRAIESRRAEDGGA
jgi:hypothetical protein